MEKKTANSFCNGLGEKSLPRTQEAVMSAEATKVPSKFREKLEIQNSGRKNLGLFIYILRKS